MFKIKHLYTLTVLLFVFENLWAQEDVDLFGYFQVNFAHIGETSDLSNSMFNLKQTIKDERNSFMVQQANIFLRKDINADLTAWINFEIKNSFSSERGWGHFNLEEAWVKYNHNSKFNIKAGLLIPEFNNLLPVRNRTPYLPYIMRPLVYETSVSDLFSVGDFFPEKAYFQVYGMLPASKFQLEYAAFVGNSEAEYISTAGTQSIRTGEDTTAFVSVGGRLGMRKEKLKLGVSFTHDRDHQHAIGLGDVPRWRLGTDLSFAYKRLWFEGELISVKHDLNNRGVDLDKLFYYTTLGYDFSDSFFAYSTYNYLKDKSIPYMQKGVNGVFLGAGFRPNDALVIKAQFTKIVINDAELPPDEVTPIPLNLDYDFNVFAVALSVFF